MAGEFDRQYFSENTEFDWPVSKRSDGYAKGAGEGLIAKASIHHRINFDQRSAFRWEAAFITRKTFRDRDRTRPSSSFPFRDRRIVYVLLWLTLFLAIRQTHQESIESVHADSSYLSNIRRGKNRIWAIRFYGFERTTLRDHRELSFGDGRNFLK